jgi:hypothetical protein
LRRLFQHDLEGIMPHILEPKQLKEDVKRLHAVHCTLTPPADATTEEGPSAGMAVSEDKQRCAPSRLDVGSGCQLGARALRVHLQRCML